MNTATKAQSIKITENSFLASHRVRIGLRVDSPHFWPFGARVKLGEGSFFFFFSQRIHKQQTFTFTTTISPGDESARNHDDASSARACRERESQAVSMAKVEVTVHKSCGTNVVQSRTRNPRSVLALRFPPSGRGFETEPNRLGPQTRSFGNDRTRAESSQSSDRREAAILD